MSVCSSASSEKPASFGLNSRRGVIAGTSVGGVGFSLGRVLLHRRCWFGREVPSLWKSVRNTRQPQAKLQVESHSSFLRVKRYCTSIAVLDICLGYKWG